MIQYFYYLFVMTIFAGCLTNFILISVCKLSLLVSYTQSQSIYSLNSIAGKKQDTHIGNNSH